MEEGINEQKEKEINEKCEENKNDDSKEVNNENNNLDNNENKNENNNKNNNLDKSENINENKNENNKENKIPKRNANSLYRVNALKRKIEIKELEEKDSDKENNIYLPTEAGDDDDEIDEEQDALHQMSCSKRQNYTVKNMLVPKFSFNELTNPQLTKIYDLKVQTEEEIAKTVKNKNSSSIVKALVSKKKNRFCFDGFDLDLTYITTRIIAMGFPSTSIEGLYRNPLEEVQRFFNTRHPSHYKVYNLCEEKTYSNNLFYKQGYFPFKDHEAPPLNLIRPFCDDAKSFLDEDEKNVIAVHCKAGKGRTGTLICCLLLYMKVFDNSDECLQYYGMMRAENGKGVTIPSQIRYVNYFEKIIKDNMTHPITFIKKKIKKIRMFTIPKFHKIYTPIFTINNNKNNYCSKKKKTVSDKEGSNAVLDFDIDNNGFIVEGDVQIIFYRIHIIGKKENIFKLWFNTNFIPNDSNIYEFDKKSIDKANNDIECKYFKEEFKIEVHFGDV
jgi:phosphatidylinositol-3,4,5-trisphosphate 3-phosphatase/dual-specificity protein phosphatase PTEN